MNTNNFQGSILIVDDSKSVRFILSEKLGKAGYKIYSAEDGQIGWKTIQKEAIDLVICDLEMPVMDGLELCRLIKEHKDFRRIYLIMFSTIGEIETKVGLLNVGADDYMQKTINNLELIARVKAGMRVRFLEKELQKSISYMLQREKMASVGQLAAGVAHEINNPMGFITSNLSTLEKYIVRFTEYISRQTEALDSENPVEKRESLRQLRNEMKIDFITEDIKDLIQESAEGAVRVKNIVQNLKNFSRVDEAKIQDADINECIENTLKIARNEIKYKATVNKDLGNLPLVRCNPQQLSQVFMNMLVNGAQAIENLGEITIKTWQNDDAVFVSIADSGAGIPADRLNQIFEPFFTTKEVGKGTGLGLSICYDIVKKHDGEISVVSELGKGTKFTVQLPLKE